MELSLTAQEIIDARNQAKKVIEQVFAVASISRWLPMSRRRDWRAALLCRGIPANERRSFWLRLLSAAHLVDIDQGAARATLLYSQWLEWPVDAQIRSLVEAWTAQPASPAIRRLRRRIVDKLSYGDEAALLNPTETRAAEGLRRLNLLSGSLTPLGQVILRKTAQLPPSGEIIPWQCGLFSLQAGPQENYSLLWELEAFLLPYAPGQYLLTPAALRAAAQMGSLEKLISIIERGQERPLPPEVTARILKIPAARLLSGAVLEFDSPAELAALRRSPTLRRQMNLLLSPRHVLLKPHQVDQALASLRRAGIPLSPPVPGHNAPPCDGSAPHPSNPTSTAPEQTTRLGPQLSNGELADLYCLALSTLGLGFETSIAPALLNKIEQMLPPRLRRAASRRSRSILQSYEKRTAPPWRPPDETDQPIPHNRVEILAQAAQSGETVPVYYLAAGRAAWERRRLTPLLIERRGIRLYLIAYCHERRANRTFRLERLVLELEGFHGTGP